MTALSFNIKLSLSKRVNHTLLLLKRTYRKVVKMKSFAEAAELTYLRVTRVK